MTLGIIVDDAIVVGEDLCCCIDRIQFHAIGKINSFKEKGQSKPKYQDIFGDWILEMGSIDKNLIAITPAMREGSGLVKFSEKFPDRYFDVAIAEQHAVTFAAGLSLENKKPIVAIYSTFLQRAYDQLIHDVAVQNLDVTFAIDRAGLVGEDGPTHSGNYDIAFMRCIPNLLIMTPSNEQETRDLLTTAYYYNGPAAVRYPRGSGPNVKLEKEIKSFEIGKANLIRKGKKEIIFLNFGALLEEAKVVCDNLDLTLIDMRFVKPLDSEMLLTYLNKANFFVSLEDGSIAGGAGSAVQEFCMEHNIEIRSKLFGIEDKFIEHASREEMLKESNLTSMNIERVLKDMLEI